MIKVTLFSDIHLDEVDLGSGDLLLFTGDALRAGTEKEYNKFINWFKSLEYKEKVFVPGNHDIYIEKNTDKVRRELPKNIHLLIDEEITIFGLKIWGTPYVPKYRNWAFMKKENELYNHFIKIPYGLDFLLTHGPPEEILDYHLGRRLGSSSLRYQVDLKKPKIHAFGHIHESSGIKETESTIFINSALFRNSLGKKIGPISLILEEGEIKEWEKLEY